MLPFRATIRRGAERYCTVSLKSLALWRILLGGAGAYGVLARWPYVDVFYSESGMYSVAGIGGRWWVYGPLAWLDGGPAVHVAFALLLAICLAFMAGFQMRFTRYLLLPAMWSLETRASVTACGAEGVMHLQALYSMALPTAEVWSVDRWLRDRRMASSTEQPQTGQAPPATTVRSPFYALILLQIATIYTFAFLCKHGPSWRDGTAAAHALNLINFISPLGAAAANAPQPVLTVFSYGTLATEGLLPLLLLSPWARKKTHFVAGALMMALHGGVALTMDVGAWGTAMCCFLPLLWHPESESSKAALPRSVRFRVLELVAASALLYLGAARLGRDIFFVALPRLPLPGAVDIGTQAMQLTQPWMMFSPHPATVSQILVVDATTRSGRHFDPFRREALGTEEVLNHVPIPSLRSSVFNHYESELATATTSPLQYNFSKWVLAQRPSPAVDGSDTPLAGGVELTSSKADDPVTHFDAWAFLVATRPGYIVPEAELEARVGVQQLPAMGKLPVKLSESRGVWAPERAIDGKVVPNGTHVFTPVSASMSAGCPHLTLDLGSLRPLKSALIQADAYDEFMLEGSRDGSNYQPLGEVKKVRGGVHHLARIVPLTDVPVRFVRIKPARSGTMRHMLSEIALFDHVATAPTLPSVTAEQERFYTSLERPAVAGVFSVAATASPGCPAEAPRQRPTRAEFVKRPLSAI